MDEQELLSIAQEAEAANDIETATEAYNLLAEIRGSSQPVGGAVSEAGEPVPQNGTTQTQPQRERYNPEGSILDPLSQGLGFGFTDEAVAGLGTGFALLTGKIEPNQVGDMYESMREGLLEQRQSFQEDHPVQDFLAEMVPMVVGGLPAVLERYAASGMTGAAAVGGGEAALYGAGTAEGDGVQKGDPINVPFTDIQIAEQPIDISPRVVGAVTEAPIGMVGGAAGAKAIDTTTNLIQTAANKRKLAREGRGGSARADIVVKDPSRIEPSEGIYEQPEGVFEVTSQFLPNQPRVVKLKNAPKAERQGIDRQTIASIAKANKSTREEMRKLTRKHYQQVDGISTDEAYEVLGDQFKLRLDKVRDTHEDAIKAQSRAVQSELRQIKGDSLSEPLDNFADDLFRVDGDMPTGSLNKHGISVDDKGNLDFSGVDPTTEQILNKGALNSVWKQYKNVKTAEDLHKLRQSIDRIRKNPPAGLSKLDDVSNSILVDMRGSLRKQLELLSDDYAEANGVISKNLKAFEALEESIPKLKKINFNDPKEFQKALDLVSLKTRGLNANTEQGILLRDTMDTFDSLASEYGGKFDVDLKGLARYYLDLQQIMGTSKKAGFGGQIESSASRSLANKISKKAGLGEIKAKQIDVNNQTRQQALIDVIDEANKRQK